jgi:molybdenum cofactor cytidylyltransferase
MDLKQAIRAQRDSQIAFVGAGGKTTAIFQLARQMKPPVFVANSTHLAHSQALLADRHVEWILEGNPPVLDTYSSSEITLFTADQTSEDRWVGLKDAELFQLQRFSKENKIPLLIESDGSRQRPLKAPADHEPAIPGFTNHVVVMAGISGIGKPLTSDWVHRPEIFSRISGRRIGEIILPGDLGILLSHPEGGLKKIPPGARKTLILNQAENIDWISIIQPIIKNTFGVFDSVLVAELQKNMVFSAYEKSSGIILAAGSSERFGKPKQLVEWNGKPILRHVVENALSSSLSEVIVVIGAVVEPILEMLSDLPVKIMNNKFWQAGQSSSIHAGLEGIDQHSGSAIFLLGDQPQISGSLINEILGMHSTSLAPIIAPEYHGHRANPVLFDKVTFDALRKIEGDVGGRAIFKVFKPMVFPWNDNRILFDIDRPEDINGISLL